MSTEHQYHVYLLTNWNNMVMYVGVTSDLNRRLFEHRNKSIEGFTAKCNIHKLVYYETTSDVQSAIARERKSRNGEGKRKIDWSRE
jgi:putative endonuclease